MPRATMFDAYFEDCEVRREFRKEYISLWPEWLGEDRLHLLDEVGEEEWSRFNALILSISKDFRTGIARYSSGLIEFPDDFELLLDDHPTSMRKDASQFSKFVIPDLNCVITEEWDYTYILWHKNISTVDTMKPYILHSKLHHFSG